MDELRLEYSHSGFVENDPICVPHLFHQKQDIEIAGFMASTFAWGQRVTIVNKAKEFIQRMDNDPFNFVKDCSDSEIEKFKVFKHRTFNGDDAIAFLRFLKGVYSSHDSMEDFLFPESDQGIEQSLIRLNEGFKEFSDAEVRSFKHVQDPRKGSACKRMNMFFRWMVRQDSDEIDFGIWTKFSASKLICPLDVHVAKAAYELGLIESKKSNWKNAVALTTELSAFDPKDPVKYDVALFSLGMEIR